MGVIECYDTLTGKRCYKSEISPEKSIKIMEQEIGKSFDSDIFDVFQRVQKEWTDIKKKSIFYLSINKIRKVPIFHKVLLEYRLQFEFHLLDILLLKVDLIYEWAEFFQLRCMEKDDQYTLFGFVRFLL